MVREESMKELKQRQQRLQERTLWLKEQEESVMRKTRLCMLVMAGIFFLLVMVQSGVYMVIPQEYQESVLRLSRYGKWILILTVVIINAVLKDSEMEGE